MNEKKAFIEIKFFEYSNRGHIEHVLRIETQRDLSGKITINGDPDEILKDIQQTGRGRRATIGYFEVVFYHSTFEEATAVKQWLEARFPGHPVCITVHDDEAARHSHAWVRWKDEAGKSIRLQKRDLEEIPKAIAQLLG